MLGSQYNIPICIWLLDNHPLSSPMVYVKPTQDMLIKPSRHVDQNGKVYLPYLHEWNPVSLPSHSYYFLSVKTKSFINNFKVMFYIVFTKFKYLYMYLNMI